MADIKKFLDRSGVSTLWTQVAAAVEAEADRAKLAEQAALEAAQAAQKDVDDLEALVGVLPEGTAAKTVVEYVNKKTEGIATSGALAELQGQVSEHESSLAILEGGVEVEGSVANLAKAAAIAEVATIVNENANGSIDTLNEIAAWIINDTTGAASMANDISGLKTLVGDESVATQIATAITSALKVEGVDKYALASDLTTLAGRVKALEDAGHVTQAAIDTALVEAKTYAEGQASAAQTAAIAAAATDAQTKATSAENAAKAHADGLNTAMDARVKVLEAIDHGKILTDANTYTDTEIAKIQALTEAEILAAIDEVKNAQ